MIRLMMCAAVTGLLLLTGCVTRSLPVSTAESAPTNSKTITFDGKEYSLAWVNVNGINITNEYLLDGTTLEAWQTLLGVRLFKGKKLPETLSEYMRQIKPVIAAKPQLLSRKGVPATEDVTLVLFLMPPDRSYYEYDLHRFVQEPGGVKAYQFAQRLPFEKNLDVTTLMERQADRLKQLNEMNAAAQEEK